jgi:hypothetical protein
LGSSFERSIVESPRFAEERSAVSPDVRRFDEAMRAIDLKLSRNPESGIPLERGLWATCVSFPGGPTFAIYYTFDDVSVVLQSVQVDRIFSDW